MTDRPGAAAGLRPTTTYTGGSSKDGPPGNQSPSIAPGGDDPKRDYRFRCDPRRRTVEASTNLPSTQGIGDAAGLTIRRQAT